MVPGPIAYYTVMILISVVLRQPVEAQFVLELDDLTSAGKIYTVCGRCSGTNTDPSTGNWRCGDGVKVGADSRAVSTFTLYKQCMFTWKWGRLNKTGDEEYESPQNRVDFKNSANSRVFNIGDGVCPEGQVKTTSTKWGEMVADDSLQMNHGSCSPRITGETRSGKNL